jgi:hypothetical protein
MVYARNTLSGQIADVSPKLLEHPVFGKVLELVDTDAKPYVAELHKPGTKQEKATRNAIAEPVVTETEIPTIEEDN